MRLYHFTSEKFGILAIRNRRLKIARLDELNDPFELLGVKLTDANRRRIASYKRTSSMGIVCLSRSWRHPLLWSHYAEKHSGLCLGFEVETATKHFSPVTYLRQRREHLGKVDAEIMEKLLFSKFDAWSYEAEYRTYCPLLQPDAEGLCYLDFSSDMRLTEVIVGERSKITRQDLAEALGADDGSVTSWKARAAFKKFKVVENRDAHGWQ